MLPVNLEPEYLDWSQMSLYAHNGGLDKAMPYSFLISGDRVRLSRAAAEEIFPGTAYPETTTHRLYGRIADENRPEFRATVERLLMDGAECATVEAMLNTLSGPLHLDVRFCPLHNDQTNETALLGIVLEDQALMLHSLQEEIRKISSHDNLTGLRNRRCLAEELTELLQKKDASGAVLMLDVDDFKVFNDVFGHDFGNKILINFSRVLKRAFPGDASIYRYSDDEFAVCLPKTDRGEVESLMERLLAELRCSYVVEGHTVYSTASVGAVLYPQHGACAADLMRNASIAVHAVKNSGKNDFAFFTPSSPEELGRQYAVETELRTAVEHDLEGFRVVYQPIVDANSGKWIGAEALLRWISPTLGAVDTEEVIHMLEATGLIVSVGSWVLQSAVSSCAGWHKNGFPEAIVHVNLSVIQLDGPGIADEIGNVLKENDLPPRYLMLELTETVLISKMGSALKFCQSMRAMGVGISMDDFGTGYSSLSYLRQLPIDQIKVDRSFLVNVENDDYNQSIIAMVRTLAHSIHMTFCVEGVEELPVWRLIKGMGADVLQGYYFGKPMDADRFEELYKTNI